ncbi:hypothetical protein SALB1_0371 [Salinisphaera sp. LB1]|nr:hypothetical protein SALB1_0371 [Salinisphaera sp. LB1]
MPGAYTPGEPLAITHRGGRDSPVGAAAVALSLRDEPLP